MVGLIGKLQLFGEAIRGEFYGLALIGILSSVVGVYYYLRVIAAMYFLPAPEVSGAATTLPESIPWLSRIGLAVVVAIVVAVGFYPEPLIRLVRTATSRLITTTSSDSVSSPGPSVSA
jgi:NADH-quinone oxidoreductase subunit N